MLRLMVTEGLQREQEQTGLPRRRRRPAEPPAQARKERGQKRGSKCPPTCRSLHKRASQQLGPLVALSEMTSVSIHALHLRYSSTVGRQRPRPLRRD